MDSTKSKFEIITCARKILDLPESATLTQIKKKYTHLIKKWHPDKHISEPGIAESKTREIIEAYKTIMDYCDHYQFSFTRQEVEKYLSARERWFKQFGNNAVWPG